ncbi:MAG: 3-phosphoserine/phosphohydroxythreonine transaminase [Clostridia bacterium]|jgi:phosphoserine aminotransferase|nr:3-phosphoserine/phosphohydroxythreonine transaminase [Clostridia bacterium]
MERVFNFAAGPSALPLPVLEKAQRELLCYPGAGCSVMEMSHRSSAFQEIAAKAQADLRKLMDIPDDYAVLFLQGGASTQFSMVPMNLMEKGGTAAYAETGNFAKKAAAEAKRWGKVVTVVSSKDENYSYIPEITDDLIPTDAAYLHITGNNTIYGTQYRTLPKVGVPLVADLSSSILGRVYDVTECDLIYAGAQKNMGPAGLTVVIVKRSLIGKASDEVPAMLNYALQADADSMYNTPPCFSIYIAGLVFAYLLEQGGVAEMERRNAEKSGLLYAALDGSKLFKGSARADSRSNMNVTFTLPSDELTAAFVKGATAQGMINLKGHRAVGGIRASLYNGMPIEGVQKLVEYMKRFEKENG